jgi:hypothetical protein
VIKIALNTDYQRDFRIYYNSILALNSGLNPYNLSDLSKITGVPERLGYVYLPSTFLFFQPFVLFKLEIAKQIYIALKCIALIALVKLWEKAFLSQKSEKLFYVFCLLTFNGALYIDFITGNISVFEQLLIWAGLYFFLKQRYNLFCSFIFVIGLFKITPLLFLTLVWFTDNKKKHIYFFGTILIFLIVQLVTCLWNPDFMVGFLQSMFTLKDQGSNNPATFQLVTEVSTVLTILGLPIPAFVQIAFYIGIVATIINISLKANRKLKLLEIENQTKIRILYFCVITALILPRFKDYSYILLLVPAYFILRRTNYNNGFVLLFILMVLLPYVMLNEPQVTIPFVDVLYIFAYDYYPLLLAYAVWGLYLFYIFEPSSKGKVTSPVQFVDEAQTLQG